MAEGDTFDPTVPLAPEPAAEPVQQELPLGIDAPPPPGDVVDIEADDDEDAIETIEVEIGGKTYTVPKAVEDHLLREEDYTQKTQTLAEQRKAVEAYQVQLQEKARIQEAVLEDIATVRSFDAQLQEYNKIDWPAYQLQDPNAAQYHYFQYQQLQEYRNQAAGALNAKMQHVSSLQSQNRDAAIQKTITALSKPDPEYGWPGYSPAYMDRLSEAARVHLGMTNEQMSQVVNADSIKYINLAVMMKQNLKKAVSGNAAPAVEARPVRQIPSARGRTSPSSSGDEMPIEKWIERERKKNQKAANGTGLRFG